MATQPRMREWAYEEFAQLPDDGNRYEVIAGTLAVTPPPSTGHQEVVGLLQHRLTEYVLAHGLGSVLAGPVAVLLSPSDYVIPDLLFVRADESRVSKRGIEAPPDLVVEVPSPATAARDRGIRRQRYAALGVPLYWVVDRKKQHVEVHPLVAEPGRAHIERETLEWRPSDAVPPLAIDLPALFGACRFHEL